MLALELEYTIHLDAIAAPHGLTNAKQGSNVVGPTASRSGRQADTPPLEPLLGNEHILWQEAIERVDKNLGKSLILNAGASAVIASSLARSHHHASAACPMRSIPRLPYVAELLNPARRSFY